MTIACVCELNKVHIQNLWVKNLFVSYYFLNKEMYDMYKNKKTKKCMINFNNVIIDNYIVGTLRL